MHFQCHKETDFTVNTTKMIGTSVTSVKFYRKKDTCIFPP